MEPSWLGPAKTRSYPFEDLHRVRLEEHPDGSGDLIFTRASKCFRFTETIKFMAIDRPRDVEALVPRTMRGEQRQADMTSRGSAQDSAATTKSSETYKVALRIHFIRIVALGASALSAFCLLGNVLIFGVALVIRPSAVFDLAFSLIGFRGALGVCVAIGAALGSVAVCGLLAWAFWWFAAFLCVEITIRDGSEIDFRSWFRTVTLSISDILAIYTGEWHDPNRTLAVVQHKGGRLVLVNQFPHFADFLATVKALNPTVQITGF